MICDLVQRCSGASSVLWSPILPKQMSSRVSSGIWPVLLPAQVCSGASSVLWSLLLPTRACSGASFVTWSLLSPKQAMWSLSHRQTSMEQVQFCYVMCVLANVGKDSARSPVLWTACTVRLGGLLLLPMWARTASTARLCGQRAQSSHVVFCSCQSRFEQA